MRPSSDEASRRMKAVRTKDTRAEVLVRKALHAAGLRFRKDVRVLQAVRRRADVVFSTARVVVLVNGCFWHCCSRHATWPRSNAAWWREKLAANRRRDADTVARLTREGWKVVVCWEHEDPITVASRVARIVRARTTGGTTS